MSLASISWVRQAYGEGVSSSFLEEVGQGRAAGVLHDETPAGRRLEVGY